MLATVEQTRQTDAGYNNTHTKTQLLTQEKVQGTGIGNGQEQMATNQMLKIVKEDQTC